MTIGNERAKTRRAGFKWAGVPGIQYPAELKPATKTEPKSEYGAGSLPETEYMTASEAMSVLGLPRPRLTYYVKAGRLKQEKRIIRAAKNSSLKSFFTRESVLKLKQELEK
jgi:hypothetical protein